jgi:hypothetical protein
MTIPQYGKLTNVLLVTHMIAFIDIYKLAHNCGTAFHPLVFSTPLSLPVEPHKAVVEVSKR